MSSRKPKPSSTQRSLREFFTQRQQPFSIVLPDTSETKSAGPVNSVLDGASSDEDELVAVDQLLKPQKRAHKDISGSTRTRHTHTPANKRDLVIDSSDLPELPTYAGTFSLSALLADRAVRVQDKGKMAKLEDFSTPKAQVAGATSVSLTERPQSDVKEVGKVGDLLSVKKEQRKQLKWHYIGMRGNHALQGSDLTKLVDRMPSPFNVCTGEEFRDQICSGTLYQYMHLQGIEALPYELTKYLFDELARAGTQHTVRISESLQLLARSKKTQCIDDQHISYIFDALGARKDVSRDPEGQIKHESRDPTVLFKLREVLGILNISMKSGNYKVNTTGSHPTLIHLLRLVLDSRYGHLLVAELERALHLYLSTLDLSSCRFEWAPLVGITRDPHFQFALLRALPTSSPTGLSTTQHLATLFLLHNDHGNDNNNNTSDDKSLSSTPESTGVSRVTQLTRCLHKLQSCRPFHPLTDTTSYSSLSIHIKILGYALLVIETANQKVPRKARAAAAAGTNTNTNTGTHTNINTDTNTNTGKSTDSRNSTGTIHKPQVDEPKRERDTEEAVVKDIMTALHRIHGRIVDGKAAFIERSEAKGAIQRLADRVRYTLVSDAARHSDVFGPFRT